MKTYNTILLMLLLLIGSCRDDCCREIIGIAKNGKGGAVIFVDDSLPYYINGLQEWEENLNKKKLKVTGCVAEHENPADNDSGMTVQRIIGKYYLITNANWEVIKEK